MQARKSIGLGIVGSGRIGTLRAKLAAGHPGVRFVAVSDADEAKAQSLASTVGADFHSADNDAVIGHPDVDAVVVSTPEGEHVAPLLKAISLGKPVLVEKPLALTLADADAVLRAIAERKADVRVGYSRRYKERYLIAKEQIVQGRVGRPTGAAARVFNSRSQALAMLARNPHATPVVDALTYYVDLMNWLLEGRQLKEVYARGQMGVLQAAGHEVADVSYAILTYDDSTVVNLGVSYALPAKYPALGHAARVEILGTDGVMILDDDHTDQLMYTEHGIPHVYLPGHQVNMVFLQSGTPGDWALGEFWGPIANEAKSPPDGYTLLMGNVAPNAINVSLFKQLPFDPVKDFAPVSLVAITPNILVVHPALPVRTVKDLIALAKAKPGELNYPSAGIGSSSHLAGELLRSLAKVDIVHVPYKGGGPALIDLLSGQMQIMFATMPAAMPHVKSGRLRPVAVTTSKRSHTLPDLPTVAEGGVKGYEAATWYGLLAPAGTPQPIVTRLHDEVVKALNTPDMREKFASQGFEAAGTTPAEFAAYIQSEISKWGKVIRAAGIRAD